MTKFRRDLIIGIIVINSQMIIFLFIIDTGSWDLPGISYLPLFFFFILYSSFYLIWNWYWQCKQRPKKFMNINVITVKLMKNCKNRIQFCLPFFEIFPDFKNKVLKFIFVSVYLCNFKT